MRNTLKTAAIVLALTASASHGEELAPDALVKTISLDVLAAIQKDKDIQGGNPKKIASLVEAKILPHFDFAHTTRIAMGANWRRASPEQREQLVREFRTLLVRTYSGVLVNYRDRVIEFKPLRAQPGDAQVTVRSEVRQSGAQAVSIDYEMERTPSGWKVYDVKISGASLFRTRIARTTRGPRPSTLNGTGHAPNPTERREQDYEGRKPLFGCCFGIVNCSRYPTALRMRARQFATAWSHAAP